MSVPPLTGQVAHVAEGKARSAMRLASAARAEARARADRRVSRTSPRVEEQPRRIVWMRDKEGGPVATPKEREEQRKQERQRDFDRQVDSWSLVVRQMTAEERSKYAESPQAAAERHFRRARKRS